MRQQPAAVKNSHTRSRLGVTLTEVLMSLMIMSIGVTSVAVLFPISVLRSIQATQLTNGAITKYNVETLLSTRPALIFDPDGDGNTVEHFRARYARNYVVDPAGFFTHAADGNLLVAQSFGNRSGVPVISPFSPDPSNEQPLVRRFGGGIATLDGENETNVSDPLHLDALRLLGTSLASQGDGWTTQVDTQAIGLVPGGVVLPPPGELNLYEVPTSNGVGTPPNRVPLLPEASPGVFLIPDPELYRIVVFSVDGRISQAFPLTHIDPGINEAYWSEVATGQDFNMNGILDDRTLPVEFGGAVGRVLLQSRRNSDFSWLLTIRRRGDGVARGVDVVVRFSDGTDVADEQLHHATFVQGTNLVGIVYDPNVPAPNIRKGKFIFDAVNARWYRVRDYQERSVFGWPYSAIYDAVITTETEIVEPSGEDQFRFFDASGTVSLLLNGVIDAGQYDRFGNLLQPFRMDRSVVPPVPVALSEDEAPPGDGDGALTFGYAMFPAGIVDVYPMGSRQIPAELANFAF